MIISVLPVLFCGLRDKILRNNKPFYVLQLAVAFLSLWGLWRTGSRGAMLGFCAGAFFVAAAVYFRPHMWKAVLAVLIAGSVLISGYVFFGITPGGTHGYDDTVRLRLLKNSYAMWQDHKLLGVGLANWQKQHAKNYLKESEIQQSAQKYYIARQTHLKQKVDPNRLKIYQNFAVWNMTRIHIPHNSLAWFFTTTGVIGGIGYLVFIMGYLGLFLQIIKKYPEEWIVLAGFWVFVAVGIHGLVDVGIAYINPQPG